MSAKIQLPDLSSRADDSRSMRDSVTSVWQRAFNAPMHCEISKGQTWRSISGFLPFAVCAHFPVRTFSGTGYLACHFEDSILYSCQRLLYGKYSTDCPASQLVLLPQLTVIAPQGEEARAVP